MINYFRQEQPLQLILTKKGIELFLILHSSIIY